jgi:hypothetical protein
MQRLPEFKIRAQMANLRKIRNHIDDGYCLDYFTLMHCKVVGGVDMTFLLDEQPASLYVQNANYQGVPDTDIDKLATQSSQNIENLKRMIHHDQVNRQFLPSKETVSKRNLLETRRYQDALEFRSSDIDGEYALVSVIKLPK